MSGYIPSHVDYLGIRIAIEVMPDPLMRLDLKVVVMLVLPYRLELLSDRRVGESLETCRILIMVWVPFDSPVH